MSLLVKHFVANPKVLFYINDLELSEEEKSKLIELTTLLYHQKLLNKFLDRLEQEDKKIFMEKILVESQESSLDFLHEKIEDIEKVVEEAIFEIEEKLMKEIKSIME